MEDKERAADAAIEPEDVASATECTGLLPALPADDAGQRACAALYAVHRPAKPGRMFRKK